MVLFLADYPTGETQHEGASQRIHAVDRQFRGMQRIYLFVSHRRFLRMQTQQLPDGAIQYRCHLLIHFFFIRRLMRHTAVVYIHSIINALPVLPLLPFVRREKLVLDAHGLVPEEQTMAGARRKGRLYGLTEKILFRRLSHLVVVTNAMAAYFNEKYPSARPQVILYPILPAHLSDNDAPLPAPDDSLVHVIYSGNTQPWQNVELMLQLIRQNRSSRMRYHLLTGEPERMHQLVQKAGLAEEPSVRIQKVAPQELGHYYRMAHYGFVLRDDIPVNRVACPTKLVEYLYYGIIPVVKSPDIGDFRQLGYEYLPYRAFSDTLVPEKSGYNRQLVQHWIEKEKNSNPLSPIIAYAAAAG